MIFAAFSDDENGSASGGDSLDIGVLANKVSRALRRRETYDPMRNPFVLFGMFWGLPIPVFFLYFHWSLTSQTPTVILREHPIHWLFMAHPLFFGIFFGVIGSLYQNYHERLKYRATHDDLTGLLSHSRFQKVTKRLLRRHRQADEPMSLIMLDLDHFKQINDNHGHQEGDRVLENVASLIKRETRPGDYLCRYGGEEFAVALPRTDEEEAFSLADRLRVTVAAKEQDVPLDLSLSGGVATYPEHGSELDELIFEADRGLYRAKAEGRNRIL